MSSENLNERQKKAVETLEGPLLILAGAGAGKTKTLTHRISNLVRHGTAPQQILAITFTNKAAKEMRDRVNHLLSNDRQLNAPISFHERPFVSTFHSLGVHIIKENCKILDIPRHFTIYDRNDSKRAVKNALEDLNLDPKQYDPNKILSIISREKGDGVSVIEYNARNLDYFPEIVGKVWEKYENQLKKDKSLDFDDLLLKTMLLLRNNKAVRDHYAEVWKYVHIDEYQDTNKVQYEIARLLAEKHRNICVVGDIDQNIYSWRGADIQNILNFEKDYPEATVILLEENYRSTQVILTAANKVIEKNVMRREKKLFTKNTEGELIELNETYDENEEARTIAEKARELVASGVSPEEIAVLYRANFQSRILEEAFLRKSVPYQILGTRFFDRKEVKDVLSFIRLALNPENSGDLSRVINVPPRGIGKVTLLKILEGKRGDLSGAMQEKVNHFFRILERIREVAATEKASELVKFAIKETGIEHSLRAGDPEDQERLENLREMVTLASKYDETPGEEGIEKLLSDAALATDQDELEKPQKAVKLMTVHASKGLEFDYVFISGLEEDLFPHARLNEEHVSPSGAEEERRLFYVALTRARKKLFLSFAAIRTIFGAQKVNTPSQFIADIDAELIERNNPHESGEEPRGIKAIFIDF